MAASVETREDLLEYAAMPYSGNTAEMLEDRFGIRDGGQGLDGKREDLVLAHSSPVKSLSF